MWREYFPNASIIGFDIADFSKVPELPGLTIVQGDIGKPDDLMLLVGSGREFDIIIDDASHASHHQQIALGTLFPYLKRGGYYIIEDLNYQPPDLELPGAMKTKDFLQAIRDQKKITGKFISRRQTKYLFRNIAKMEFFDSFDWNFDNPNSGSIVFIRKL